MKKIYIAPQTEVVKINAEQMICESLQIQSYSGAPSVKLSKDDDYDSDSSDDLW